MTKTKKTMIALGLAVIMLVGVSYVFAAGPGFGRGHGPGSGPGNCPGYGAGSNLSTEQQTQLRELQKKHYNEMAPLREKMFNLRQELRSLWSNPNVDATTIQAKEQEFNALRDQMRDQAVQLRLEARGSLTPDQISALGSGCGRGGRGRGPGPGRF